MIYVDVDDNFRSYCSGKYKDFSQLLTLDVSIKKCDISIMPNELITVSIDCRSFLTPLHIAADKSHYDVMDILLKHGAQVSDCLVKIGVQVVVVVAVIKNGGGGAAS